MEKKGLKNTDNIILYGNLAYFESFFYIKFLQPSKNTGFKRWFSKLANSKKAFKYSKI